MELIIIKKIKRQIEKGRGVTLMKDIVAAKFYFTEYCSFVVSKSA